MPSVSTCRKELLVASMVKRAALAVVVALAAASCTDEGGATTQRASASATTPESEEATATRSPAMDSVADGCPVTVPRPVDDRNSWRPRLFGWASSHGNGELWVGGLGRHGVIGRLSWKLGWWREVPGDLRIAGRRLDAEAEPLRAHVPSGYGRIGFQSSGVTFPTEGCWQVTGQVHEASLTFVTLVRRA